MYAKQAAKVRITLFIFALQASFLCSLGDEMTEISLNEEGLPIDEDPRCRPWAVAGECRLNPQYMLVHCRRGGSARCPSVSRPRPYALPHAACALDTLEASAVPWTAPEEVAARAAREAGPRVAAALEERLVGLLADTFTQECRDKVDPSRRL